MILGSQRSPSNKKHHNSSTRQWAEKKSPQPRISFKKLGTSFDAFSEVSKATEAHQVELENVEFEVSYDFTKDIKSSINKREAESQLKSGQKKKTKTHRESLGLAKKMTGKFEWI